MTADGLSSPRLTRSLCTHSAATAITATTVPLEHRGNWYGEETATANLRKEALRTDLEPESEAESNSLPTPPMMSGVNGIWKK